MRILNILVVSSDEVSLGQIAKTLTDEGVRVQTSQRLFDVMASAKQEWDFLLVDLDGLNSFMRSMLPAVCGEFPNLPMIGMSRRRNIDIKTLERDYGLALDAYVFEIPQVEDLIVSFPHVAAKYLCDTGTLRAPSARHLPADLAF
jgi:hypothetical protein